MRLGKPCGRIRRQLDAFLENRLPPEERSRVRDHLQICPSCRDVRDEWLRLNESLAATLSMEPAPPGFAGAVMRAVRQEAAAARRQDWTWLDLAVRWVFAGLAGLMAAGAWLGLRLDEAGTESWKTMAGRKLFSAEQSVLERADVTLAEAKRAWFDLLLLPDRVWNESLQLTAWWDHPAVPAAVMLSLTGLTVWAAMWFRTGEPAR